MPSLKFSIRGVQYEYIGGQEEIIAFLERFADQGAHPTEHKMTQRIAEEHGIESSSQRSSQMNPTQRTKPETEPIKITDLPLPDDETVMNYILSKPQYTHDLVEIQQKFFSRTFQSRGKDQRMYHRTARQLELVRKTIEKRFGGTFKGEPAGKRNLRRFIFVKTATIQSFSKPKE